VATSIAEYNVFVSPHQSAFQVVFDVRTAGFHPDVGLASVVFILAVCAVIVRYGDRFRRLVASLGAIFLAASTASFVRDQHKDYVRLRDALNAGRYQVVEGTIEDFVAGRRDGHGRESFRVGSHQYAYSNSEIAPGYRRIEPEGGSIRLGMRVRIYDVGGAIAHLEVQRVETSRPAT